METLWYSKGIKHYRRDMDDWLCLRKFGDQSCECVILHEGTHHYFKEMYLYDARGRRQMKRRLDGPGPFEIEMDEIGDCEIFVRVHFFGYSRPPVHNHEILTEKCAVIRKHGREEPVVMQINNDPAGLNAGSGRFPGVEDIRQIFAEPARGGSFELVRGDQRSVPFHLGAPADSEVVVFMFGAQRVPPGLAPGREVDLAALMAAHPQHVVIRAGQHAPAAATVKNGGWSVAIPVRRESPTRGTAGKPLAVFPLIADLEIEFLPPSVYASWTWLGPQPWTSVHLAWDFYSGDEYADYPEQSCVVTMPLYRGGSFKMDVDSRLWRHWCIRVTATALLNDEPTDSTPELEGFTQL